MARMLLGPVMFFYGTLKQYNELEIKVPNGIYYIKDDETGNKMVFFGEELFPVPYMFVTNNDQLPKVGVEDYLYINSSNNLFYMWDVPTKKYKVVYGQNIVHIDTFIDAFQRVSYDTAKRIIYVPFWDRAEKKIKTLTINLGKDLILEKGSYYDSKTRKIRLKLVTPDSGDIGENDGFIDIPVDDLVDIYEGTPADEKKRAIVVTVDKVTDTGSVDVRHVRATLNVAKPAEGEKPNAAQVRNDGVYVDVETYTDKRIGNLGNDHEGNPFKTVSDAIKQAQKDADKGIEEGIKGQELAKKAQELADANLKNKVDKTTKVCGHTLDKDIILTVTDNPKTSDIPTAAPLHNAKFTGTTRREDNIGALNIVDENGEYNDNANEVATLKYVVESFKWANTWGGIIRFVKWNHFLHYPGEEENPTPGGGGIQDGGEVDGEWGDIQDGGEI